LNPLMIMKIWVRMHPNMGGKFMILNADEDITLVNDQDDEQMFNLNDLQGEEVFVQEDVADKEVIDKV
nr:hypothetical protein [Tanacetum cinerariifolium]